MDDVKLDKLTLARAPPPPPLPLRYSHGGGHRGGLDGGEPVLDGGRAQKDHQRGPSGEGLPDTQDPHRGQDDPPPRHRGGPTTWVTLRTGDGGAVGGSGRRTFDIECLFCFLFDVGSVLIFIHLIETEREESRAGEGDGGEMQTRAPASVVHDLPKHPEQAPVLIT